jgi:hypothetical protein
MSFPVFPFPPPPASLAHSAETNPSAEFFGFDTCQFVEHAYEATKFYSQVSRQAST